MALFPPIVASSMPAFSINPDRTNSVRIYYTLSEYNSNQKDNILAVHVSVRNQASNVSVVSPALGDILIKTPEQTDQDLVLNRYFVTISEEDLIEPFDPDCMYKVQLRFSSKEKESDLTKESYKTFFADSLKYFSEWSTVCIIKPILAPVFYIDEFYYSKEDEQGQKEGDTDNFYYKFADFTGVYEAKESSETLKAWRLRLLNSGFDENQTNAYQYIDDYTLEDSGWNLISAYNYTPNTDSIIIEMSLPYQFNADQDTTYKLLFEIKTRNDYESKKYYTFDYNDLNISSLDQQSSSIHVNEEQGYIKVIYKNKDKITGNLVLRRKDSITNTWFDLKNFQAHYEQLFTYYDFTAQSGITYQYLMQIRDARGRRGATILLGNEAKVTPEWQHAFLLETSQETKNKQDSFKVKQLKLKYDFQISSYKTNISENKTDTIGSKYPFIRRNGNMYYRSFPITGTITHYMDNVQFFTDKATPNENLEKSNENYFNSHYDYIQERRFREQVEQFLYNMKPKLYKSTQEGNILVKIMEVSLTPKTELDRLIYTFSATAYEIDEPTLSNLDKHGIISIGVYNPVVSYDDSVLGQVSSFKSDQEPIGNVYKAGYDLIGAASLNNALVNSIAKKEKYKEGVDGEVLDDFKISYIRITVESQPYLIVKQNGQYFPLDDIDDGEIPSGQIIVDINRPINNQLYQIESTYNYEQVYLGTLFEINKKPIIISYPNNIYELKEDFLALPASTTIVPKKDSILSIDYSIKKHFIEDTSNVPKRISIEKKVGQIYGMYNPDMDLIKKVQEKYNMVYSEINQSSNRKEKVVTYISEFSSITIDAEPGSVFLVSFKNDNILDRTTQRFVINETGELTIDANIESFYIKGLNFSLNQLYNMENVLEKDEDDFPLYPINKSYIKKGNNYYIYYRNQWRVATLTDDLETLDMIIPIELMLFYTISVRSDYY